jgi:integrase
LAKKPSFGRIYKKKYKIGDEVREQGNWTVRFKGKDYFTGSPDYKAAERKLLQLAGEAAQAKRRRQEGPEATTVHEILDLVLADYKREGKADIKTATKQINDYLRPFFDGVRAAHVNAKMVDRYKDGRLEAGAKPATVNRELSRLRRAYTLGHEYEIVNSIPKIKKLKEDNVRTGFLPHDRYEALLLALPDHLRCMFVVAYHVGDRKGELLNLRPEQIDLPNREIVLYQGETKNGEGRVLPIYGDMIQWLRTQLQTLPTECYYVFHRNGCHIGRFDKAWKTACKAAGVPDLRFHDLRRSAVRNLIRAGVPRKTAMQITGHKTESVFERYNIVDSGDLRDAAKKVESYIEAMGSGERTVVV